MPRRMPANLLSLFRRRWAAPILGTLHRGEQLSGWPGGAKFVTLCHALQTPREPPLSPTAVRESLDYLIELGWVERNSGHGHPLRPEYILTRRGEKLAPTCASLDALLTRLNARDIGLRRWSMPVIHVVNSLEPARFNAMAERLDGITDRALSLAIKGLHAHDLIDRRVDAEAFPVATSYGLAAAARPIGVLLAKL
jgi:DNA-binding HxlR family transcriptional regulator